MKNCFPASNPNPLAPPWMFPTEWLNEAPEGYRDEYQCYPLTQALTAGQVATAVLSTDTPGHCNFYWRWLGVFLHSGAGRPAVRIRDSEGHMMFNTRFMLRNDEPFGRCDYATPLTAPHRMPPGARLTFDFQEVGGAAGVTVVIYIQGFKRWPVGPNDARGGSVLPTTVTPAGTGAV